MLIVIHVDVIADGRFRRRRIVVNEVVRQLVFQVGEEAFLNGIVVAVTFATHERGGGSGLTNGHGLNSRPTYLAVAADLVSERQT